MEWQVSRRRIGRIMKQEGLVSNYTVAQYKPHVDKCNESQIANVVNRQFKNQPEYNVVVSDLTYAVAEVTYKIIKTEFVKDTVFLPWKNTILN